MSKRIFGPLGEEARVLSPETLFKARCRKYGITARKFMGDDQGSWAVFVHNRPAVTGLTIHSVSYYKRLVLDELTKKENKA